MPQKCGSPDTPVPLASTHSQPPDSPIGNVIRRYTVAHNSKTGYCGNMTDLQLKRAKRHALGGRHQSSGLVGIVLIGFGAILLLKNYGVFSFRDVIVLWPVLPILWGAQAIARGRSTFTYLVGGMAIALGGLKLLDNLDIVQVSSKLYGPLVLIALGVAFLICNLKQDDPHAIQDGVITDLSRIHPMVVFGGVKQRVDSQTFEGGEMLALFGGVEIDFRKAKLRSETATIEANAVFGGIQLRVPETWTVEIRGSGAFGGYEDKTIPPRQEPGVPSQKLVLTGNAVFGGISVEN